MKKFFILAFIGILLMPGFAFAQVDPSCDWWNVFCNGMKLFNWVLIGVAQVLASLVGWLTSIVASFIPVLLKLSANLAVNPLVKEGFRITLSIANLGFVLVIIVIAFATILRYAGYGFKDIMWKLVVAALLINFSFAIAGVIIDFNNILGNYFIGAASPGNIENFSSNLANSLNTQKLAAIKPQGNLTGEVLKYTSAYIGTFIGAAAILIFSVVTLITFSALAFMLLIRYLYLVFLLIVMPIVWLCWVFPNLKKYWSKWWDSFIRWNFFFPAVSFFIYLAIFSAQAVGTNVEQNSQGLAALAGASTLSDLSMPILITFLQIFVQVGLIFGGLIIANKLGIEGAAGALKLAKGARDRIIGATGKVARGVTGVTALQGQIFKKGGAAEKLAGGLAKVPGFKGAAAGLYNVAQTQQKAVGTLQKEELDKDSTGALLAKFNTFTTDKTRRAALVSEVVKRGLESKVDAGRLNDYLKDAKDMGATKDILANAPQYAPQVMDSEKVLEQAKKDNPQLANVTAKQFESKEYEKTREEAAIKLAMEEFQPKKTDELSEDGIRKVAKFFRKGHFERLAKEGTIAQLEAAAEAAEELKSTEPGHPLVKFATESPAFQRPSLPKIEKIETTSKPIGKYPGA